MKLKKAEARSESLKGLKQRIGRVTFVVIRKITGCNVANRGIEVGRPPS